MWRLRFCTAAGDWGYCGTGQGHFRAMCLKLIISVTTIGCAVTLDALEPRIIRIFHCNVEAAMYFSEMSTQNAQKTKT